MHGPRLRLALLLLLALGAAARAEDDLRRAAEVRDHQACIMLVAYVEEGIDHSKQMAIWRRECDRSTLRDMVCAVLKKRNVSTAGMSCAGG